MRTGILAAASLALMLGTVAPASATAMIDVNNLKAIRPAAGFPVSSYNDDVGSTTWQTFTVGVSGKLTEIDLFGRAEFSGFEPTSNVVLEILRGGSATTIGVQSVGVKTLASTSVAYDGVTAFDLSALGIFVTAGETMTFKMSVDACPVGASPCARDWFNWLDLSDGTTSGDYAGGSRFSNSAGGSTPVEFYPDRDLNFRTWVDSSTPAGAAPEPAAWALMILGFGSVGVAVRRRRERAVAAHG